MSEPSDLRHATIPPELAGQRLDRALAQIWPDLSRSRLKAMVAAGLLEPSRALGPADQVRAGDTVSLRVPPPVAARPVPQEIPLAILYEDDAVLVIDKPAGLVVHPAHGHADGTLVNAILAHCGDRLAGLGGERRPGIVHRLDKDTSGVMVIAKSDAAHRALAVQFAAHSIEREYIAFASGAPVWGEQTIDAAIGRHPTDRKRMAVVAGGRRARTICRVVGRFGEAAAMIRCQLETGRTHQIRVHLAHVGHPVLGDPVYMRLTRTRRGALGCASDVLAGLKRQALHAAVLGFMHPISQEFCRFETELPVELHELHKSLISCAR